MALKSLSKFEWRILQQVRLTASATPSRQTVFVAHGEAQNKAVLKLVDLGYFRIIDGNPEYPVVWDKDTLKYTGLTVEMKK